MIFEGVPSPVSQMRLICSAAWLAKAVTVAAELEIADLLASNPRTVDELVEVTNTHPDGMGRLMRMLAAFGVFASTDDGKYTLTPLGSTLRQNSPDTLREYIITMGRPWYWQACGDMRESVHTGETTWERRGESVFRWLAEQPEDGQQFARAMNDWNGAIHTAIATAYDCSEVGTLIDVGGAHGSLLREFLIRYPHLYGILLDFPPIARGAAHAFAAAGLDERVECVGGDFFEAVPPGGDLYLLSFVLHDWSDENAGRVLRNCRAAMHPGSRLLIAEMVLPTTENVDIGFIMDMKMLVHTSGRERTLGEYQSLLEHNGFAFTNFWATTADASLIEAVPN
jgi:predicted transcriptional regulator